MDAKVIAAIMFSLVLLVGLGAYLGHRAGLFAVADTFTPIYCNDYEFTCCNEQLISSFDQSWGTRQGDLFTCSASADRCQVDFSVNPSSNIWLFKSSNINNCHYASGIFVTDGYVCTDGVSLGSEFHGQIQPNDVVYITATFEYLTPSFPISIDTYKSRLDYCGRAGCTTGVPVLGADKCTFQTDKSIYGTAGQIIKTPSASSTSYTVPKTTCVLAYQSGDRHICGNKEEQCAVDTDCSGHTYGNKECSARNLQTYGCKKYTDPNSATSYDTGWTLGSDLSYTASRCEITSTQQVQCCGDTDCGSNAFCDHTTFTCKQQVQCTQNSDCGVSQTCDWTTNQLKTPVCQSGQCSYNTQAVGCCLDTNCPQGYFCAADRTCKESSVPKQACPFACCSQSSSYFDKPCVSGETCCGDNTCKQDCGAIPPVVDEKWCQDQGGKVVETVKSCSWVQQIFGCKGETTKVCSIPHTPILAVIIALAGIAIAIFGFTQEEDIAMKAFGMVVALIGIIWLILASTGVI